MDTSMHKRAFSVLRMILILVLTDQENFLFEDGDHSILCPYCVPMSKIRKNICKLVCLIPQPFEV